MVPEDEESFARFTSIFNRGWILVFIIDVHGSMHRKGGGENSFSMQSPLHAVTWLASAPLHFCLHGIVVIVQKLILPSHKRISCSFLQGREGVRAGCRPTKCHAAAAILPRACAWSSSR